ncbi:T9SS type A sorting domain-containing protein [Hyphobacterium sp. CCMP332]|nr:T9SS type A sorting domain-containing protein [Hyphobacterium sp. CCMP332]
MKQYIKLFSILFVFAVFVTHNSNAQLLTITNTTIPSNATSCTNSDIIAFVQVNCINFPFDSITSSINGNVIDVNVYYQELIICLPAINFTSHTANLGNVPAGSYTVNVTGYLNMGNVTNQMNTVSGNMTVISCCNAVPGMSYSGNVCEKDSVLFTSTSIGAQTLSWYIDNQFVSSDSTFNQVFDSAGSYEVKIVVNGTSCSDSLTQTVIVNSLPDLDIGPDVEFCEGDSVMFDAGPGWVNVLWSDGSTGQSIYYGNDGNLTATVTDQNTCQNSDTVFLIERPKPLLEFGNEDTLICNDQFPITFSATGPGYSYLWHNGSTDSIFVLNGSGWAACTVTDTNGCANYDSIFVIMLICDGLDTEDENYLLIYPNPTKESLSILGYDINLSYKIYNEQGVEVQNGILIEGESKIQLSNLKRGLYFLQTESNMGSVRKAFIIH